jgi:hypothetical protein
MAQLFAFCAHGGVRCAMPLPSPTSPGLAPAGTARGLARAHTTPRPAAALAPCRRLPLALAKLAPNFTPIEFQSLIARITRTQQYEGCLLGLACASGPDGSTTSTIRTPGLS